MTAPGKGAAFVISFVHWIPLTFVSKVMPPIVWICCLKIDAKKV
jgi:hypothetical protein